MLKTCTRCGAQKLPCIENFRRNKQCAGGWNPACRPCTNEYQKEWKRRNYDKISARRRELYTASVREINLARQRAKAENEPYKARAAVMREGVRVRSRELGFPVPEELRKASFIMEWLKSQPTCEACGVEFLILTKGDGQKNDASPSIDRFDTSRGYDMDNVSLICWRCNNIKRNYQSGDLICVAEWMVSRRPRFEVLP